MKVLRHAPKKTAVEKVCTIDCPCGCKFEFTNTDPAIQKTLNKYDHTEGRIACPDCGTIFRLSVKFFV